jgi:chromosome segregation ATPase
MVSSLEDQVKQTSAYLSKTKDAVYEKDSDINREILRSEQAERTAEDFQRRLTRTAGELQASDEKVARLEERIGKK